MKALILLGAALVSLSLAAAPSLSRGPAPRIVTYIPATQDGICGTNVAPPVDTVQISRLPGPNKGWKNSSPFTRTVTTGDAWNLYREVCAEPRVTSIPFCPFDPGVAYRLTFFVNGQRVLRVEASAGGCDFLTTVPRSQPAAIWATSPGFWLLLAQSLGLRVSRLFPQAP